MIDKLGICQYRDEHCLSFTPKGHCSNCNNIYFLNGFNKCQVKDENCEAYSGGRCIDCKTDYYLFRGSCYPNSKGCLSQKTISKCLECDTGYVLEKGICTQKITKLSWGSIDMDFGDESDFFDERGPDISGINKIKENSHIGGTIEETVEEDFQGEIFRPRSGCVEKELCWMGLELCEEKEILGFSIASNPDSHGKIETVFL